MAKRKTEDSPPEALTDVTPPTPANETASVSTTASRPRVDSPEWPDFVWTHFTPSELVVHKASGKQCPRVNALWRVTELLIGPIVRYVPRVVKAPTNSRDKCSVVEALIEVSPRPEAGLGSGVVAYGGVGDATELNVNQGFEIFPDAMAETRAKGRACRTALRLHNAVALEEMVDTPAVVEDRPLQPHQLVAIEGCASRANVNVRKFIEQEAVAQGVRLKEYGSLRRLPAEFGQHLCKKITQYQASGQTPASIAGYDPNWKGDES